MEDDFNGRQAQWKTTSIEDDLNGRWPQVKTTSKEDNFNGRRPQYILMPNMTWFECQIGLDYNV